MKDKLLETIRRLPLDWVEDTTDHICPVVWPSVHRTHEEVTVVVKDYYRLNVKQCHECRMFCVCTRSSVKQVDILLSQPKKQKTPEKVKITERSDYHT